DLVANDAGFEHDIAFRGEQDQMLATVAPQQGDRPATVERGAFDDLDPATAAATADPAGQPDVVAANDPQCPGEQPERDDQRTQRAHQRIGVHRLPGPLYDVGDLDRHAIAIDLKLAARDQLLIDVDLGRIVIAAVERNQRSASHLED